jgi:hypothetical protein
MGRAGLQHCGGEVLTADGIELATQCKGIMPGQRVEI